MQSNPTTMRLLSYLCSLFQPPANEPQAQDSEGDISSKSSGNVAFPHRRRLDLLPRGSSIHTTSSDPETVLPCVSLAPSPDWLITAHVHLSRVGSCQPNCCPAKTHSPCRAHRPRCVGTLYRKCESGWESRPPYDLPLSGFPLSLAPLFFEFLLGSFAHNREVLRISDQGERGQLLSRLYQRLYSKTVL